MYKPVKRKRQSTFEIAFFVCVLLACLVPRYISTFKIRIGVNISMFTIAVGIVWLIYVRKIKIYNRIESLLFGIWFLFVLFSLWRSEKIGIWTYYILWTSTALLFMQLIYKGDRSRIFDIAIYALVTGLLIHVLIGLYEITAHRYLFQVGDFSKKYYGTTAISIFHNPNDFVTFAVTILPFSIYLFYQNKGIFNKLLQILIIVLDIYLIIKSESRGGFLSVVMLLITMVVLYFKKSDKNKLISITVLILTGILLFLIPATRNILINLFSANFIDTSNTDISRVNLIKNGLYFLRQTYGFGVGAGNIYLWLTERSIYDIGQLGFIHNWYVEILVTFGVFFFAIYMYWHIKVIVKLIRAYDRKDHFWNLHNTFLVSFIGFSIVSISSSSNVYSEWIWMYMVLVSSFCLLNYKKSRMTGKAD